MFRKKSEHNSMNPIKFFVLNLIIDKKTTFNFIHKISHHKNLSKLMQKKFVLF